MNNKLSEDDKFKVHGIVDVAGLVDGRKYRVVSVSTEGSRFLYTVKDLETGDKYVVSVSEIDPYIGSKTYIQSLESFFGQYKGYISVI